MDDFKEFQGKSLDEAIRAACSYFDAQREKLEIDIIQDAKNGIFGLVGARKAIVRWEGCFRIWKRYRREIQA